jgi:hypothetical protein
MARGVAQSDIRFVTLVVIVDFAADVTLTAFPAALRRKRRR